MGSEVVAPGLWSTCSIVLAHTLASPMAGGDLSWPRVQSVSLVLAGGFFTPEPLGKLLKIISYQYSCIIYWVLCCCCCPVSKLCLTLWSYGLQHVSFPCLSLSPGICSNSWPLCRWCHPTISSSVTLFSSCPQSFPQSGSFPMSCLFCIRWPEYWRLSFNISPSNQYSGLISFRIDWFDLLAFQVSL